ncbi:MAG: hypothetical protein BMS9Abin29_2346 [Gemmatimonadota bacterium]|nr:MAG: hypothetical protein BMS9Abin29_2346 [Gemmatimonadota bacterium]
MSDTDGTNTKPSSEATASEAPTTTGDADDTDIPSEAFISPDEPIERSATPGIPSAAFISPDDPIRRTQDAGGVVVGMDGRVHHLADMDDPHLEPEQVANILEHTAEGIRTAGMAALQVSPDVPRFEAVLRAYLAGYFGSKP